MWSHGTGSPKTHGWMNAVVASLLCIAPACQASPARVDALALQDSTVPNDKGAAPERDPTHPLSTRENPERTDVMKLAPEIHGAELRAKAFLAYQRGFDYLVRTQNQDGSWGSHDPTMAWLRDFGFQTDNRGSQDGVRNACTAIVAKALLRKTDRNPAEQNALDKATEALLGTERFAYEMGEAFNTWGYGYKLDFLCDYLETAAGNEDQERIAAAAKPCIEGLKRFQQADGGWNYYAGVMAGGESMSFNTANFAEALFRASRLGLEVPRGLFMDAAKLLQRMRTARGGVVYDARFILSGNSVNELSSASRTAAVIEALAEMNMVGPKELDHALLTFNEGENWLEDGRKLIQPHTAVHQVSGYFFFYGYHYLSELMHRMGEAAPVARWERNAWTMIRTQEEDGRWWDTAAADYGDKWGTGFALLTLQRYLERCKE